MQNPDSFPNPRRTSPQIHQSINPSIQSGHRRPTSPPIHQSINPSIQSGSPHRADTVDAYQKSVERLISRMKQHLADPLDLEQLAQIAAISKFHLVRVFDEITGTTPHHFLA